MAAAAVLPAPTQFKAARAVVAVMEAYRDARVQFVTKVGELAVSPQVRLSLKRGGSAVARRAAAAAAARAGQHGVRSSATLSLGRLANVSHAWSHHLVQRNVLPSLCKALTSDEAVARIALSVLLSDVARHSLLHATAVADAGGITAAVSLLGSPDVKTRRQVCVCLSTIARHSEALALESTAPNHPEQFWTALNRYPCKCWTNLEQLVCCTACTPHQQQRRSVSASLPSPGTLNPSP
ncbi:unnamed protein product, partial [Closterium sp. Naga37s-1]